jgi:hypothetical protein
MVPMDVPDVSLDMVRLFVTRGSFATSKQSLDSTVSGDKNCPLCPVCPSQTTQIPTGNIAIGHLKKRGFVISYAVAVAVGVLVAVIGMLAIFNRRARAVGSIVPQYDLEMRETQYTDKPDGNFDENGEHESNRVI